ncbi:MAG: hypothetical protein UU81_C0013G0010 [Microgenomates group bacterium GW2011_GWC1_41_8]|uniref:Uncharacterized protein n=2 Tax=Candidatus Roizmaniibacteriota TaxID=1752723 RepID=A0A0G0T615_9BACT|nr:MAG: hypothetical protein UT85_C0005G0009 [Candidatus Levybacteria bacterium GW2011_GWA2_40_16]KKR72473.1 MAG: hypothetical protein UU14_C0005G0041 [Candidatus Roizmanbacteria bacterium GW2011_GWB1_40_7]KKR94808.1 MAG: hypothetical protein UU41_C0003G0027 [Candidatus Roizmanbacteria bacterium GW2011_GWA1_41_13]KKS24086.1 MAG: hypothetical protein UU81_C0013G0010 [Microgenomates group bacterium GW2011_GWC1_41_8]OGK47680.1 MAG: hypothetical protein A3A55_01520 [Candidatus Roizmanbacteria bacte
MKKIKYTIVPDNNLRSISTRRVAYDKLHLFAKELYSYIEKKPSFYDQATYDIFIGTLHAMIRDFRNTSHDNSLFEKELFDINRNAPLAKSTEWGGITYKYVDVERNKIKKMLVVKKGGTLGFEYHDFKRESLEVKEGVCIYLGSVHKSKGWSQGKITLNIAVPGDSTDLAPYDEHGLLAVTNCVVLESSTYHLEDLKYIFTSRQMWNMQLE